MEKLTIESNNFIPEIRLDPEAGLIEISGKSYPENTFEVYEPVITWIKEYFNGNAKDKTTVNFSVSYFNSSSSKVFYDIFAIMNEASVNGNHVEVNWIYDAEDDSTEEDGEDFKEDFDDLIFNLVAE